MSAATTTTHDGDGSVSINDDSCGEYKMVGGGGDDKDNLYKIHGSSSR
jgi:hypothetical protein